MENGQGSNPKKYPLKKCESKQENPRKRTSRIPGPAGVIQASMAVRARGKVVETEWLPTQEYLENIAMKPECDDSFNQAAWQNAVGMCYPDIEGYTSFVDVRAKQENKTTNRVPLAMGVVTKIEPLDDMKSLLVELKDPTGTMKATIHHGATYAFDKKIVVGCVIVLGNCVVFKPDGHNRGNMYFNIVKENILMLISVGGDVCAPKA